MMKRKFSFDMPRLKIGPTRAETKALRDQLNNSSPAWDSPPPTPRSVRPPLSPKTDAELRASCAYVLQNFKPSNAVFKDIVQTTSQTTATAGPKPPLDYAAIREMAHSALELGPPLRGIDTDCRNLVSGESGQGWSRRQETDRSSTSAESSILGNNAQLTPRHAILQADDLMGAPPTRPTTSDRPVVHTRHDHHAQPVVQTAAQVDLVQRPKISQRNASLDTAGSTPFTESTEYPWSDRASTAMTSAMMTPARSSKRTSQAMQFGSESGSLSQGNAVDGDWMRQELEKHKRVQEGFGQVEKLQEEPEIVDSRTGTITKPIAHSAAMKAVRRKSLPASVLMKGPKVEIPTFSSKDGNLPQRTDCELVQTHIADSGRSRSRSRAASRISGKARSISRGVKEYLRPRSVYQSKDETEVQQAPQPIRSRGRSISRYVMDYVRSEKANGSQKASVDLHRSASRARSVRSMRSTASGFAPSIAPVDKQWRPWRRGSTDLQCPSSVEISRPDSAQSEFRGRGQIRGTAKSTKRKSRVDLNHELPPLPSLDSWKPPENETPQNNRASASKDSVMSLNIHHAKPPALRYAPADGDEAMLTGYPTRSRSHRSSEEYFLDPTLHSSSRRAMASVQRYMPSSVRDSVGNSSGSLDVHDYRQRWPSDSTSSSGAMAEHNDRRPARTARGPPPQSYREPRTLYEPAQPQIAKPVAKAQLVNFSRPGNGARAVCQGNHIVDAHVNSTNFRHHSRTNSEHARSSQYYRGYDQGYISHPHNVVNIDFTPSRAKPSLPNVKETSTWKWWHSKLKKQETSSDHFVTPGQSNGHSPIDQGAAAPFIRY